MPIDPGVICRNFTQMRDAFKSHGDSLQSQIDQLIADVKAVLQGPFLTEFTDNMDKATTVSEQMTAVNKTGYRIERLLMSIAGTPLADWPGKALQLLRQLLDLLQALKAIRELEKAMDGHVAVWCG